MTKTVAARLVSCLQLILIFQSAVYAQWSKTPGPFGGAVYFLESYAGAYWVGSESGLYRSDNGQQWSHVENIGAEPVIAGLADQDTFYLIRGQARSDLMISTDGGQSWRRSKIAEAPPTNDVSLKKVAGALIITSITPSNLYLRSKDNGVTIGYLPGGSVAIPDYFDANGGLIIKSYGESPLSISQNGGNTFFNRSIAPGFNTTYQVVVLDSALITRVQSNGGLLSVKISFDTAQTWQSLSLPPGFDPDAVALKRCGKKGLLALIYGQYAWTTDYGASWKIFSAPETPWGMLVEGNEWLLFSEFGIHRSSNFGADWTDVNAGFVGRVIYQLQSGGNHLYALDIAPISNNPSIYIKETENVDWARAGQLEGSWGYEMATLGSDTLVSNSQLSLDGGQTWTYISYPGVSSLTSSGIEIHNNYAYVSLNLHIYKVPLIENPTATVIYGPSVTDNVNNTLFVGDTLYANTSTGHIFLQLPGTTDWIPLTSGGPGYGGKLFRVNGRFFLPRWTDIRYSDDGIHFDTLHATGLNISQTEITTIYEMIAVGSSIVAATEMGLFFSTDKGEHWWPFQTGLPAANLPAHDLILHNGILYAAMLRQGVWQRSMSGSSSSGVVFRDDNQNGIQEPEEPPLPNVKVVSVLSDQLALTDSLGRYHLIFDLLTDTIRAIPPVMYAGTTPTSRIATGMDSDLNFGIHFQADKTDIGIAMTHTAAMRPGFDNNLVLRLMNVGTKDATASAGLKLPSQVEFLSANPAPDGIVGDSLYWNSIVIPVGGEVNILLEVRVESTTALGSTLAFSAFATTENMDSNASDNAFALEATVVGSYDPNDKQVWPGDHITPEEVAAGMPLRYTIRFQNTGNYLAERVRLIDTLDTDLDLSTLTIIGASHPFSLQVKNGRVLDILFDQIQLPDSISNPAGSHGFFSFSINAKRTLSIGTELINKAAIYFDYNSPVNTNSTFTKVSFKSSVSSPNDLVRPLIVFPNPVKNVCIIQMPSDGGRLELYDAAGKLQKSWSACTENMEVNLTGIASGTFYFQWRKEIRFAIAKVVITGQ